MPASGKLEMTTIGSFPRLATTVEQSMMEAVELQRRFGISIFSDGEQRNDMISYFAESLPGLGIRDGIPYIASKIKPPDSPSSFPKISDLDFVRSRFPSLRFKVTLTGPATLAIACGSRKVSAPYSNILDHMIYQDLADALTPIAAEAARAQAFVQVDEPMLSQGVPDYPTKLSLIDRILAEVPYDRASLHVCGDLRPFGVFNHLLRTENVSILSHAFSGKQESRNVELLERRSLEDAGKKLGLGCISVSPTRREDVDHSSVVLTRIHMIANKVGLENVAWVHPDCGLRATQKELVPLILGNMQRAVERLEVS